MNQRSSPVRATNATNATRRAMNSRAIKRVTTTTDDDGNDAETTDTTPVYATFAEDVTGFFGKWNLQPNAPRSKRLGSPARDGGRGGSGRAVGTSSPPPREPKWTDETDEDDEYLFSDYDAVTPAANRRVVSFERVRSVPGARAARGAGNAAKLAAKSFKRFTSRAARGMVGVLSDRSSVFDFKMFKLFTFVLNVTLSTFEIPRQLILIPLIVGSRLAMVPEWLLSAFEYDSWEMPRAKKKRPKLSTDFKFPTLRWNALKTWENAMQAGRESLRRVESQVRTEPGETPEMRAVIDKLIEEGLAYDKACDSQKSQAAFERALELRPKDPVVMISLSKELSDRVFDHEIFHNKPQARQLASRAADLASEAIELAPENAQCYIALAVANARLSMFSDARQKVELTHSIKGNLMKALEIEPESDYAYHVLARFEHTMAHIGGLMRYLIKTIYGAIEPATIERAEEYFRRAIEINPKRLIHGVELAKLLYETKRYDECKELLVPSIELEIEDINSVRTKKDGEALLKKLTNKLNRTPSRLSMSRTPSKHRLPRTSSSSHTPMSPLTPISRNNSKGSGLFD